MDFWRGDWVLGSAIMTISAQQFQSLALSRLTRVLQEPAFKTTSGPGYLLTFRSPRVTITVSWVIADGDVEVRFTRPDEEPISLLLYLRAIRSPLAEPYARAIPASAEEVESVLSLIATALAADARPLVEGSPRAFEEMMSVRWWNAEGALDV